MDQLRLKRLCASELKANHSRLPLADPRRYQVAKSSMLVVVALLQLAASRSVSTTMDPNEKYRDGDLISLLLYK